MRRGSATRKANPRSGIEREIVGEVCTVRATRCMHRASSLRVDGGWLADGWRVQRIGPGGSPQDLTPAPETIAGSARILN